MKKLLFFLLCSITLTSCEKLDVGDCFMGAGNTIIVTRDLDDFNHISLNDNINLIITQDTRCGVKIEAGENLIPSIITEVSDHRLIIRNNNICNWVRSYNKEIDVYVSVEELISIEYISSGNVLSTNTIVTDSLSVAVWDGSGIIDLDIETRISALSLHYGAVNFSVRGKSNVNFIYAASYGPFFCENLETAFTFMNNRGSNDCYVYCTKHLGVDIEYTGNIYYKGNPETISANITGTGQLIELE